jgi:hypothetical protein
MVYQAPRRKCLQNWPKNSGFNPRKKDSPVAPLLILENLPNHPDSSAEHHESRDSVIDAG